MKKTTTTLITLFFILNGRAQLLINTKLIDMMALQGTVACYGLHIENSIFRAEFTTSYSKKANDMRFNAGMAKPEKPVKFMHARLGFTGIQFGGVSKTKTSKQWVGRENLGGGWWKVERIFTLYLRLSGIPYKRVSLQGYSQGEWCEGIAYLPEGLSRRWRKDGRERLDSLISTMEDWWRGDVYQVTSQELVTYHTADGKKTYQRWEQVEDSDVFGGITGDITLDTCNEMFGY
jgi:hypothetical protein